MRAATVLLLAGALSACESGGRRGAGGGGEGEGEWWDAGGGWEPGPSEGEGEGPAEGEGEGSAAEGEGEGPAPPPGCDLDVDCGPGYRCIRGRCIHTGGEGEPERPELPEEQHANFGPVPVQGDDYVFVALPGLPAIARIHAETASVDEVPLRGEATAVTTLPGRDVAVVLTSRGTAAVVESEQAGDARVAEVDIQPGLTHLRAAEAAPWVVAWADHDHAGAAARGNPSEVTAIDLSDVSDVERLAPPSFHLSVGSRPRDVSFDRDGLRLFVTTDHGVSVVELASLAGDRILPPLPVHEDALAQPEGRRVILTPDGAFSVVLQPGEAALRLVDLVAETDPQVLRLDAAPTDVALVPSDDPAQDGRRALAVLRSHRQVLLLDIPGDWRDGAPEVVALGEPAGQVAVAPGGEAAVLFSSVSETSALQLLDLTDGVPSEERVEAEWLEAPISAVLYAPDGQAAVAFHQPGRGRPLFTMLAFEEGLFDKHFTPEGASGAFTFTPDDASIEPRFLLLVSDARADRHMLQIIPTRSFIPAEIRLRAPPVDVGVIASTGQAFVTQDDPEGLITFVDLDDELDTMEVSRFRRNRRID